MSRFQRADTRMCGQCHSDATGDPANPRAGGGATGKPMFAGVSTQGLGLTSPALAVEHGADGIVVSNHGGRATETGRGTIECLAEVVQGTRGRVPVLLDGGVRRGTDIYKAIALGATAVGIGRPYIWGLSSYGQQGVERLIDILNNELRLAMVGCGTRTLKEITSSTIIDTGRRA